MSLVVNWQEGFSMLSSTIWPKDRYTGRGE